MVGAVVWFVAGGMLYVESFAHSQLLMYVVTYCSHYVNILSVVSAASMLAQVIAAGLDLQQHVHSLQPRRHMDACGPMCKCSSTWCE